MVARFKLRGPREQDIQAWILASLGAEQFEVVRKDGKVRKRSIGVWVGRGGVWQRNNSAFTVIPGDPATGARARAMRSGSKGAADIIGCYLGVPVALEVKRPGEKQRPEQKRWQTWWEAAGGRYFIVTCPREAQDALAEIARRVAC